MKNTLGMAVIGLGAVGRRMMEQAALHGGWRIASAYDLDPDVCTSIARDYPRLPLADSAAAAIEHPGVDLVYVAVPPLYHDEMVQQSIVARRPVLCEKPLGIDVAESVSLASAMNQSGLPQAVNFVFSSADAVDRLALALQEPGFGLRAIEIRLHFHKWPRDWQSSALWLTRSDQGGFVREVLSHFVFLLIRLFGTVQLRTAQVLSKEPGQAEYAAQALLDADGVPVSVSGSIGCGISDIVEARFIGARQTYCLYDWYYLRIHESLCPEGRMLEGLPEAPRVATYQRQLDQLSAMLHGQPHTLASFDNALEVQSIVESVLSQRQTRQPR